MSYIYVYILLYIYICLYNPYNNSIHTNLQNHPSLGIFGSPGWTTLHSPGRTGHPEGRMVLALVLVFIWIHFLPSNTGVCGVLSESIDTGTRTFQSRCP